MKLLRTYNYRVDNDYARWIEIPYANKAVELWYNQKLKVCNPYLDYTPENVIPIGLNPFKK